MNETDVFKKITSFDLEAGMKEKPGVLLRFKKNLEDGIPESPDLDNPGGEPRPPIPVIPPFQPATYSFQFDSYHIFTTRSLNDDTNFLSVSIAVNGRVPENQTRSMGDNDNGPHPVSLHLKPILVDSPNTKVVYNYAIVNAGHGNGSEIIKKLQTTLEELANLGSAWAGTTTGAAIGGTFGGPIGAAVGAFAGFIAGGALQIIFANCDGPVAVQQVVFTGQDLWRLTQGSGNKLVQNVNHPGIDSPWGCGSNSNYTVNWSVTRQ